MATYVEVRDCCDLGQGSNLFIVKDVSGATLSIGDIITFSPNGSSLEYCAQITDDLPGGTGGRPSIGNIQSSGFYLDCTDCVTNHTWDNGNSSVACLRSSIRIWYVGTRGTFNHPIYYGEANETDAYCNRTGYIDVYFDGPYFGLGERLYKNSSGSTYAELSYTSGEHYYYYECNSSYPNCSVYSSVIHPKVLFLDINGSWPNVDGFNRGFGACPTTTTTTTTTPAPGGTTTTTTTADPNECCKLDGSHFDANGYIKAEYSWRWPYRTWTAGYGAGEINIVNGGHWVGVPGVDYHCTIPGRPRGGNYAEVYRFTTDADRKAEYNTGFCADGTTTHGFEIFFHTGDMEWTVPSSSGLPGTNRIRICGQTRGPEDYWIPCGRENTRYTTSFWPNTWGPFPPLCCPCPNGGLCNHPTPCSDPIFLCGFTGAAAMVNGEYASDGTFNGKIKYKNANNFVPFYVFWASGAWNVGTGVPAAIASLAQSNGTGDCPDGVWNNDGRIDFVEDCPPCEGPNETTFMVDKDGDCCQCIQVKKACLDCDDCDDPPTTTTPTPPSTTPPPPTCDGYCGNWDRCWSTDDTISTLATPTADWSSVQGQVTGQAATGVYEITLAASTKYAFSTGNCDGEPQQGSTFQTDFDTWLCLFYESAPGTYIKVVQNDDYGCGLFTRINANRKTPNGCYKTESNGAGTYYVVVSGYSGDIGDYTLSWKECGEFAPPSDPTTTTTTTAGPCDCPDQPCWHPAPQPQCTDDNLSQYSSVGNINAQSPIFWLSQLATSHPLVGIWPQGDNLKQGDCIYYSLPASGGLPVYHEVTNINQCRNGTSNQCPTFAVTVNPVLPYGLPQNTKIYKCGSAPCKVCIRTSGFSPVNGEGYNGDWELHDCTLDANNGYRCLFTPTSIDAGTSDKYIYYYDNNKWAMTTIADWPTPKILADATPSGSAEACPHEATWSGGTVANISCPVPTTTTTTTTTAAPCGEGEGECDNDGVYRAQLCVAGDTTDATGAIIYVCEMSGGTGIISGHNFTTDGPIYVSYERCDGEECESQPCCAKVDDHINGVAVDYGPSGLNLHQATYTAICVPPCNAGTGPSQGDKSCTYCA